MSQAPHAAQRAMERARRWRAGLRFVGVSMATVLAAIALRKGWF